MSEGANERANERTRLLGFEILEKNSIPEGRLTPVVVDWQQLEFGKEYKRETPPSWRSNSRWTMKWKWKLAALKKTSNLLTSLLHQYAHTWVCHSSIIIIMILFHFEPFNAFCNGTTTITIIIIISTHCVLCIYLFKVYFTPISYQIM